MEGVCLAACRCGRGRRRRARVSKALDSAEGVGHGGHGDSEGCFLSGEFGWRSCGRGVGA